MIFKFRFKNLFLTNARYSEIEKLPKFGFVNSCVALDNLAKQSLYAHMSPFFTAIKCTLKNLTSYLGYN